MVETTALGAAMAAGYAEGVKVWDLETTHSSFDTFTPSINATGRQMVLLSTFLVQLEGLRDLTQVEDQLTGVTGATECFLFVRNIKGKCVYQIFSKKILDFFLRFYALYKKILTYVSQEPQP